MRWKNEHQAVQQSLAIAQRSLPDAEWDVLHDLSHIPMHKDNKDRLVMNQTADIGKSVSSMRRVYYASERPLLGCLTGPSSHWTSILLETQVNIRGQHTDFFW